MSDKCVVLLSGGVDSSTVAYWAKAQGYYVHALSFKYGQLATKEIASAVNIAKSLGATHKVIDLSSLGEIFIGVSSLCDSNIPITSHFSQPLIVPFRNAILLSVSVAYAVSINASKVFYGAQGSDSPFYPDCRREFYKAFQKAARLGTETRIDIEAPFNNLKKSEVIKLGVNLGVPYELTWSCYMQGEKHCGKCESCINRRNAFKESGVPDPTEYQS